MKELILTSDSSLKQVEINVIAYLKKFAAVSVTIKKHSPDKTHDQLRLYHGKWVGEAADHSGYSKKEIHWQLKLDLLQPILMEHRVGFSDLIFAIAEADKETAERLKSVYEREMSLGSASKQEVHLYMQDVKRFFIEEWNWTGFTDPSFRGM